MVANFLSGGAAASVLCEVHGVAMQVVDVAVDSDYLELSVPVDITAHRVRRGSGSLDRTDVMSTEETAAAITLGERLADAKIDAGADLLLVGDMGIGNTTPAAALVAAVTGQDAVAVCGRGTGIDDDRWMRKVAAIRDGLWRARGLQGEPEALLHTIGGADFAAMAGFLAQSARRATPVLLDGLPVTAAALIAAQLAPDAAHWWLAGHESAEPAHLAALEHLGLDPVLRLGMRLGEGSGALTALPVVQAALATCSRMATFQSAGVSAGSVAADEEEAGSR
jgi:nicotinate-nucleotide--dimethylbenzimidazole phosphoribosyltransferase